MKACFTEQRIICKSPVSAIRLSLTDESLFHRTENQMQKSCLCYQIITGTAPQNLTDLVQKYVPSRSRALFTMIELFASPPIKENSMVVGPSVSLVYKPGILSLSLSAIVLSLPSKLVWKLTFSHSIFILVVSSCFFFFFYSPSP